MTEPTPILSLVHERKDFAVDNQVFMKLSGGEGGLHDNLVNSVTGWVETIKILENVMYLDNYQLLRGGRKAHKVILQ